MSKTNQANIFPAGNTPANLSNIFNAVSGGSTTLVQSNNNGGFNLVDLPSGTGNTERLDGKSIGVFATPTPFLIKANCSR